MDASWRARVSNVESPVVLGAISGWQDQPLVSLQRSTKDVPVEHIALHAEVAYEAGEEYKRTHPDDPRSVDQLGSVHLYSQGWADAKKSLYAVLNATLTNANRELLKVWFLFIKLLMTALAFEPKYEGVVWRGVAADIGGQYTRGQKFRWWRFSSCTENGDVLHNPLFMGDSGKRTLFSIDCKTGVKIQHLSAFQAEAEVLLAAGTRFEVTNTITTGDLTVVSLREIQSGLPPPEAMPLEPEPQPEESAIELFHGTSLNNALQIQDTGFDLTRCGTTYRLKPDLSTHVGDKNRFPAPESLLGRGIYATQDLKVAWEYARGGSFKDYTSIQPNPKGGCVLRLAVNVGRVYHVQSETDENQVGWAERGYDSAYLKGSDCGCHMLGQYVGYSWRHSKQFCIADPGRIRVVDVLLTADAIEAGWSEVNGKLVRP